MSLAVVCWQLQSGEKEEKKAAPPRQNDWRVPSSTLPVTDVLVKCFKPSNRSQSQHVMNHFVPEVLINTSVNLAPLTVKVIHDLWTDYRQVDNGSRPRWQHRASNKPVTVDHSVLTLRRPSNEPKVWGHRGAGEKKGGQERERDRERRREIRETEREAGGTVDNPTCPETSTRSLRPASIA